MNYQQKIEELLNISNLPHKLKVRFALYCAESVKEHLTDERSIKALEVTKLWLEGKVSQKEMEAASYAASNAASNASFASYASYASFAASYISNAASYASSASFAASCTSNAASNASSASFAASFTSNAASNASSKASFCTTPSADYFNSSKGRQQYLKVYYNKLVEMVNNLTELEKVIWDIKL